MSLEWPMRSGEELSTDDDSHEATNRFMITRGNPTTWCMRKTSLSIHLYFMHRPPHSLSLCPSFSLSLHGLQDGNQTTFLHIVPVHFCTNVSPSVSSMLTLFPIHLSVSLSLNLRLTSICLFRYLSLALCLPLVVALNYMQSFHLFLSTFQKTTRTTNVHNHYLYLTQTLSR